MIGDLWANFFLWGAHVIPPRSQGGTMLPIEANLDKRTFCFIWFLGEKVSPQSLQQWPCHVPMDPPRSFSYARTLSLTNMVEMKAGCHCVDFLDHKGDCGAYLQRIITRLVVHCALPSYFIYYFVDAIFALFSPFRECPSMF